MDPQPPRSTFFTSPAGVLSLVEIVSWLFYIVSHELTSFVWGLTAMVAGLQLLLVALLRRGYGALAMAVAIGFGLLYLFCGAFISSLHKIGG